MPPRFSYPIATGKLDKMKKDSASASFTPYQQFVVFILAITQFSVILDFMIMSPLGDMLMKSMGLTTRQFGIAVSAYAISAGVSGLLTAGFADKFDRKKLLLFFYIGFVVGTALCGMVNTYPMLVAARIFTGIFGGVIGSISMAIITDLFDIHHRGRVLGMVQMGFAASQVLGIPVSLYVANIWGWQSPFILVAGLGAVITILIITSLKPVTKHLEVKQERDALSHLWHNLTKGNHRMAFMATCLLSLGGFMMMPFGSAFAINNLKLTNEQLPLLFMLAGIGTMIIMPLAGKLADKVDKFRMFTVASVWMMIMTVIYTSLGATPMWLVVSLYILMMAGMMGRMVPSVALVSGIPDMADRGAFMSINSSLQQIAGGFAAAVAGRIVVQHDKTSPLEHYDTLAYIMCALSAVAIFMLYRVNVLVKNRLHEKTL